MAQDHTKTANDQKKSDRKRRDVTEPRTLIEDGTLSSFGFTADHEIRDDNKPIDPKKKKR